ncbi:Alginate regulatory protein AlgP [Labilithrix luteola]|uniref:Alginate regulatory protein AlgP n=1 Tax=Labilithrix luteola TaxID=1391654 RepID=A0A0K1Q5D6_9BACT|nr:hypothetical protein [Labilithrix luteola]AKV00934.1 Alginate regulatory protein AlgP [Labilithrix luteola]
MLPFTKRPGRGEESADAVAKDDASLAPAAGSAPRAPSSFAPPRPPLPSTSDEEMTTLMPVKSLSNAAIPAPRPAAGVPAVRPSTRSLGSSPPPVANVPSGRTSGRKFAAEEDDEDGRTVVRGAPKIVKRGAPKPGTLGGVATAVNPSAVIKQTLDSARASSPPKRPEHLMAPPPAELLEDFSDLRPKRDEERTALLLSSSSNSTSNSVPAVGHSVMPGQMPPQALQPQPIPTGSYASAYPPPPNPYVAASSSSTNVPGAMSMPAHFMVPQAPYSDGRMDPPGTSVTSRTRIGGRPAMSWAAALLAFGLFVGVGAVAIMQGNNDSLAETGASFVDPSHAPGAAHAATQPAAQAVTPTGAPAAEEPRVAVPPVAVPQAAVPTPVAAPTAPPVAVAEPEPKPEAKPEAKVEPKAQVAAAPAPKPAVKPESKPVAVAQPVSRPAPAPRPVARPAAASDDEKPARPVAKAAGRGAAKGGSDVDEETKKALEALQKSQLESSF